MIVLLILFEAWWRRWFGGAYVGGEKWENKWFNRRITQHAINCGVISLFLGLYFKISFISTIYSVVIIEGLFWSPGHGAGFDMSRAGIPEDTSRYEEKWWNKICQFLVPESEWYCFGYDWLWMMLRYTSPCILLIPIFGCEILFMGLLVAPIYGFCASLYEKIDISFFPNWLNSHNKLAEIMMGGIVGTFLGGVL